jgi:hypothetical protein
MKFRFISATALLLASSALTFPAHAEDIPPVVTALLKSWESSMNVKPAYEKLETDSDGNITITNLTGNVAAQGTSPEVSLSVGKMVLQNIADEKDGVIDIGKLDTSNTKIEIKGDADKSFTVEMPAGSAENLYLPVSGDQATPQDVFRSSFSMAKRASSGAIKVTAMGQTITSDGYESTFDGNPATGAGKFALKVSNIVVPEAMFAGVDTTGQMKALGYGDLTFNIMGDADIRVLNDKFGVTTNIEYAGKDIGGIKMAIVAEDIPMAAVAELKKSNTEAREPDFTALQPQLMNVTIGNFKLRFEDDSITRKVLPIIAKMQGMDEATLVSNAGALVQLGMMQLKSQAMTDQVVAAVSAFLKDPKSITVSMNPAQPLAVQSISALNPADPAAALTLLGVSVTAND